MSELFTTGEELSDEDLKANFIKDVGDLPSGLGSYEVIIPRNTKMGAIPEKSSGMFLLEIVGDQELVYSGQLFSSNREIASEHWLKIFCDQNNMNILAEQCYSPSFAEVIVDFQKSGQPFIGRMTAYIYNGAIVRLFSFCKADSFEKFKHQMGFFIATWTFLNAEASQKIEEWQDAQSGDFHLQLPASWKKAPTSEDRKLFFAHLGEGGVIDGVISIVTEEKASQESFFEGDALTLQEWENMEFSMGEINEKIDVKVDPDRLNRLMRTSLRISDSDSKEHEGVILTGESESDVISVGLITVTKEPQEQFATWAFNMRAIGIIEETLSAKA